MAAGLAPSVGDNTAAFPAFGKTILDTVAGRRRNDESARFLRGNPTNRGDNQRDGKRREQRLSIEYRGGHVYRWEDRASERPRIF